MHFEHDEKKLIATIKPKKGHSVQRGKQECEWGREGERERPLSYKRQKKVA